MRPVSDEICVALQTAYAADRNDFASHVEHQFPIDGGQLHLGHEKVPPLANHGRWLVG